MSTRFQKQKSPEFGNLIILPGLSGFITFLTLILCLSWMSSCRETPRPETQATRQIQMMDDTLLNLNQRVVLEESQQIEDYISRYHWKMVKTETGLRWMIYKHGKGDLVRKGDAVSIKYTIGLINGDLVYRSDSLEPFEFETGKAKVPNGLEEALLLLKTGDRAKLIVPSHLAYGLLGDQDKIANRAILVYDVELCKVKPLRHSGH